MVTINLPDIFGNLRGTTSVATSITINKTDFKLKDEVSIKTCAVDAYMYIIDPNGKTTFKQDIPKNSCRTDKYTVGATNPSGKYTVKVSDYNNKTLAETSYNVNTDLSLYTPSSITINKTDFELKDEVSIKTCATDAYMYVIEPTGITKFKGDIPKGACRTDTYNVDITNPPGKYTVRISSYNNITIQEKSYNVSLPPLPCTGKIEIEQIDFDSLFATWLLLDTIPTTLPIPVKLTGGKTPSPMRLLVDGKVIETNASGYTSFDLFKILRNNPSILKTKPHDISIESTLTDCKISSDNIKIPSIPSIVPTTPPITPPVKVPLPPPVTPLTPPVTPPVQVPLPSVPSDVVFTKLPKGTKGTISLGNLSSDFYLTEDGVVDIDLSKLINLKSLDFTKQPTTINPAKKQSDTKCSDYITTAEYTPSHQSEITSLDSTFYVYIRGLKEACKTPITEPAPAAPAPAAPVSIATWSIWQDRGSSESCGSGTAIGFKKFINGIQVNSGTMQKPCSFKGTNEEFIKART